MKALHRIDSGTLSALSSTFSNNISLIETKLHVEFPWGVGTKSHDQTGHHAHIW